MGRRVDREEAVTTAAEFTHAATIILCAGMAWSGCRHAIDYARTARATRDATYYADAAFMGGWVCIAVGLIVNQKLQWAHQIRWSVQVPVMLGVAAFMAASVSLERRTKTEQLRRSPHRRRDDVRLRPLREGIVNRARRH
jgi:hypothetical protein